MEKVLKQRLITALILAPTAIWLTVVLPTPYFALVLGLFFVLGSWEWGALVHATHKITRFAFVGAVLALMALAWYGINQSSQYAQGLMLTALIWWALILIFVKTYPATVPLWRGTVTKIIAGVLILIPSWALVVYLHGSSNQGPYYALYLFMMVWLADSAAYFAGKKWGKNKLAPQVSPGKSWEGLVGALVAVFVYAVIGSYFLGIYEQGVENSVIFISLSMTAIIFSVLGDLAESMFKRQAQLKDSGSLLPGHGGVLDRFDSLTAAGPVFVVGLWWFTDFPLGLQTLIPGGLLP